MTTETTDLARHAFHALHSHDLGRVAALLAPDHVLEQADSLPWGGRHVGVDGFCACVSCLHGHVEWAPEVEALVDNGSEVIVCGRSRGRAKATGRPFDVPFVDVYEVRRGQIVRSQAIVDEGGMLAALPGDAAAHEAVTLGAGIALRVAPRQPRPAIAAGAFRPL